MTNIITRYFGNAANANAAIDELVDRYRVSPRIITLHETSAGLEDTLKAASVKPATAKAIAKKMEKGGAVMQVRAGHRPLSVGRITREVTAQFGASTDAKLMDEVYIHEPELSWYESFRNNPHILSKGIHSRRRNHHMADWPIPLISRRKPFKEMLFEPHARMAAFPLELISQRKPFTGSIFDPHERMANFPIGLISRRKPFTGSIFSRHARMANFPIGLISRRKPFTGTLIGRHTRMANWPFPHLINGKTGTNALIPNGPRMANFPISLLSNRKPFTGSIFSRHARMANFPIGLISQRKPFTGSIISKHGRMADMILPLVISSDTNRSGSRGRLSKMFGIPTILRR